MVDHWLDAIGDRNPIYVDDAAAKAAGHPGVVAPPAPAAGAESATPTLPQ
jgi:acyl dehydratase